MLPSPQATLRSDTSGGGREVTMASPQNRPSRVSAALQVAGLIRAEGRLGPASTAGQGPAQEAWGSFLQFFPGPETRLPWCLARCEPQQFVCQPGDRPLQQPHSSQSFWARAREDLSGHLVQLTRPTFSSRTCGPERPEPTEKSDQGSC